MTSKLDWSQLTLAATLTQHCEMWGSWIIGGAPAGKKNLINFCRSWIINYLTTEKMDISKALQQMKWQWMPLHIPCTCFLCCFRWYRQWKLSWVFLQWGPSSWSTMLSHVPDNDREYPLRNVLSPHQHIHKGFCWLQLPFWCHGHHPLYQMENWLGVIPLDYSLL